MVTKISNKGSVVIPAEMRKKYNLTPGVQVAIIDYGGVLSIVRVPKDPIKAGWGLLKGGASLIDALKKDREFEKKREQRFLKG